MLDKNGTEIRTGDVVRIEGAYFKNDNGLYYVTKSSGDPHYFGKGHTLHKIGKRGKISTAKYSTSFWPLGVFVSNNFTRIEAKCHNSRNATIEVVNEGFNRSEIAEEFRKESHEYDEQAQGYMRFYGYSEDSDSVREARECASFYKDLAEKIQKVG